jgi:hypothetical protein
MALWCQMKDSIIHGKLVRVMSMVKFRWYSLHVVLYFPCKGLYSINEGENKEVKWSPWTQGARKTCLSICWEQKLQHKSWESKEKEEWNWVGYWTLSTLMCPAIKNTKIYNLQEIKQRRSSLIASISKITRWKNWQKKFNSIEPTNATSYMLIVGLFCFWVGLTFFENCWFQFLEWSLRITSIYFL